MTKLKPCPFCGSEKIEISETRLKISLAAKGMTLGQLAERMDISRGYLNDLRWGNRKFPAHRLEQISEILDCSIGWLLETDDTFSL